MARAEEDKESKVTDYTFSTILCPGGLEVVLLYLFALSVVPSAVGVGFIAAFVRLLKEVNESKP